MAVQTKTRILLIAWVLKTQIYTGLVLIRLRLITPYTGMHFMAVGTVSLSIPMALFDRHALTIDPTSMGRIGITGNLSGYYIRRP